MASPFEVAAMRRALERALRGPAVDPNPRVGCVVLDADGDVVGEGWHAGAGTPHAEIEALCQAGPRAATALVTLEPCGHTGRTGPCTDALIRAGVRRVVHASADPNPAAAGGAAALRAAGIDVEGGVLAAEADALNRYWLAAMALGRPFVTWKTATTLDGRTSAADGSSRWITSEPARSDVHRRRAQAGAVVVGTGTVLADDPHLTVRDDAGQPAAVQPLRVVVGCRDLPQRARVLDDAAHTLHLRTRDPHAVLAALHAREIRHVWLEGGARLAAGFVAAGLVDEAVTYLAPALLGAGAPTVGDLGVRTIADAVRFDLREVVRVGDDVRILSRPRPSTGPGHVHATLERT
jgi:diaminohydroxyphosphoribosylaminopyrimidine deaminase/5-amino-6-(5-phosphoribosylamino)uracil reductase